MKFSWFDLFKLNGLIGNAIVAVGGLACVAGMIGGLTLFACALAAVSGPLGAGFFGTLAWGLLLTIGGYGTARGCFDGYQRYTRSPHFGKRALAFAMKRDRSLAKEIGAAGMRNASVDAIWKTFGGDVAWREQLLSSDGDAGIETRETTAPKAEARSNPPLSSSKIERCGTVDDTSLPPRPPDNSLKPSGTGTGPTIH